MKQNNLKHETLQAELQAAWSAETSSDAAWSDENAALGQCAVTACVVQDELGGDIVWAQAILPDGATVSHYYNVIDGEARDFTAQQFPEGTEVPVGQPRAGDVGSTRGYVLSFASAAARYELLRERIREVRERNAAAVREVVALNRYASNQSHIYEGWASLPFKATYAAAMALMPKDTSTIGTHIDWSSSRPAHLTVTQRSIVSERTELLFQFPMQGVLAAAFLNDLRVLAETRARSEILDEREVALRQQAAERVSTLRQAASAAST